MLYNIGNMKLAVMIAIIEYLSFRESAVGVSRREDFLQALLGAFSLKNAVGRTVPVRYRRE